MRKNKYLTMHLIDKQFKRGNKSLFRKFDKKVELFSNESEMTRFITIQCKKHMKIINDRNKWKGSSYSVNTNI